MDLVVRMLVASWALIGLIIIVDIIPSLFLFFATRPTARSVQS